MLYICGNIYIMEEKKYNIPQLPLNYDFETKEIMRQLISANKKLAELKGVAMTIPNESILISTLALQEAKNSNEVENIVTTQDDIFKADLDIKQEYVNASAKEVMNYRVALLEGFEYVRKNHILSLNIIKQIQKLLEKNNAGFRKVPGTTLKNNKSEVIYTPPQDGEEIKRLMNNLENFINDGSLCDIDPLIKLAIIHHQFESIHPFYDGNGRTGRIIMILYLVITDLLDIPILYLSRYITHNKNEYYRLIQNIREKSGNNQKEWEEWILFILKGVEETANETIRLTKAISKLMEDYKNMLRPIFGKQYKHELLNNLFFHPYTKIEYIERDMQVKRQTASKYLNKISSLGLLTKVRMGKNNYYINDALMQLFVNRP